MTQNIEYDLIIVGGGMVGTSLAIALAGQGMRIALLEACEPGVDTQPSYDDRAIALAYGTQRVFSAMGLWSELSVLAEAIYDIHVSDRGHFGFTRLHAADERVPALGYVMTARQLGGVLLRRLAELTSVDVLAPAQMIRFDTRDDVVEVDVEHAGVVNTLRSRLLVAADGQRSIVREQLGLPTVEWTYGQSAVVTNITPDKPHRNVAYERFTSTGPVALLPMSEQRCAVVWTVADSEVDAVLALDDEAFLTGLQQRFGYRLGRFLRVGRRQAYPLTLMRARESVRGRAVVIGNAAHTLHPIAGQGFNLGIRDVAALAEVVADAHREGLDPGSGAVLARYEAWRIGEQRNVSLATDGLARLFSNPLRITRVMRNLGLLALEFLPAAKHPLARGAMGMLGRQSRLSRGVSLE